MLGGRHNRIVDLLSRNRVVFGWAPEAVDVDAAKRAARDPLMDFLFIDMGTDLSYSPSSVKALLNRMLEGGLVTNPNEHPLMVRLPTFRDDPAAGRRRTSEILNLGVHAIAFRGVETAAEAAQAMAWMRLAKTAAGSKSPSPAGLRPPVLGDAPGFWGMGDDEYEIRADLYPLNPIGELASVVLVDSRKTFGNSREILRLRPTILMHDVPTLRRLFPAQTELIEPALQEQLAACREFQVPCGVSATAADVEQRIKQGFRVIVANDKDYPETVRIGRKAAGR
jgi:hypothetical protein